MSLEKPELTLVEREVEIRKIIQTASEEENVEDVDEDVLTAEDVRRRWSNHLRSKLPDCPWAAVAIAEGVVVDVVSVDWHKFRAEAVNIDDDTALAVDLFNLFLVPSGNTGDDGNREAVNALDNLRFFMSHLWFPWDDDDDGDDGGNWVDEHLSFRFEALEKHLAGESDTYTRLKKLSQAYAGASKKMRALGDDNDVENFVERLKMQERLDRLAKDAAVVENAAMFAASRCADRKSKEDERRFDPLRGFSFSRQMVLVWSGGLYQEFDFFRQRAADLVPFDVTDTHDPVNVAVKNSLQEAVDASLPGDVIVLNEGNHVLTDLGDLDKCLVIYGIRPRGDVNVILDLGIDFEAKLAGVGSSFFFENVGISSSNRTSGFLVENGASLTARECRLHGFETAIKACSGGKVSLKWTDFYDCTKAIVADKTGHLGFSDGVITNCCKVGLSFEHREVLDLNDVVNNAETEEETLEKI